MTLRYRYRKQIIISFIIILVLSLTGVGIYKFYPKKDKEKESENEEVLITKKSEKASDNNINKNKDKVEKEIEEEIMVDVKGYVNSPGIYKLKKDSRVIDAINTAGGVTAEGDTSVLNLSKKLEDEMVIIIYSYSQVTNFKVVKEEEAKVQEECQKGINEVENDGCIEEKTNKEETNKEVTVDGKVSINTATIEELMTLEGIGESKAKSIIEYRQMNGNFEKIEDLLNVTGIGENLLAKIKENITL